MCLDTQLLIDISQYKTNWKTIKALIRLRSYTKHLRFKIQRVFVKAGVTQRKRTEQLYYARSTPSQHPYFQKLPPTKSQYFPPLINIL